MTKREQYGLTFKNFISPVDNSPYNSCVAENSSVFAELQIIRYFDKSEAQRLIDEIQNAQDGVHFQESIDTRWGAVEDIMIQPPSVNINDVLLIPMQDMKELLQEWIAFVSS
ncbi:hypothetical protein D3C87_1088180 [compost metagenome]